MPSKAGCVGVPVGGSATESKIHDYEDRDLEYTHVLNKGEPGVSKRLQNADLLR